MVVDTAPTPPLPLPRGGVESGAEEMTKRRQVMRLLLSIVGENKTVEGKKTRANGTYMTETSNNDAGEEGPCVQPNIREAYPHPSWCGFDFYAVSPSKVDLIFLPETECCPRTRKPILLLLLFLLSPQTTNSLSVALIAPPYREKRTSGELAGQSFPESTCVII